MDSANTTSVFDVVTQTSATEIEHPETQASTSNKTENASASSDAPYPPVIRNFDEEFPKLFYVHKSSDCKTIIKEFELATNTQFCTYRESKGVLKDWPLADYYVKGKMKHTIRWNDVTLGNYEYIPFDGIPFIILGKKTLDCIFGPARSNACSKKKEPKPPSPGSKPRRPRHTPPSRKINCPAKIKVREVHKFPEFRLSTNTQYYRRMVAKDLKEALKTNNTLGERRIYIMLPRQGEHIQHTVKCDEAWFTTDRQVIDKIYALSYQRVFSIPILEHRVYKYVREELFRGRDPPPLTNKRWFPSRNTLKNFNYHARLRMRKEGILVPLPKSIERTKKPGPAPGTKPGQSKKSRHISRPQLLKSQPGLNKEGKDAAEMLLLLDTGREEEVTSSGTASQESERNVKMEGNYDDSPNVSGEENESGDENYVDVVEVVQPTDTSDKSADDLFKLVKAIEGMERSEPVSHTDTPQMIDGQHCLDLMRYVQSSAGKISNRDTLRKLKESLVGMIEVVDGQLEGQESEGPALKRAKTETAENKVQQIEQVESVELHIQEGDSGEQQVFYLTYT